MEVAAGLDDEPDELDDALELEVELVPDELEPDELEPDELEPDEPELEADLLELSEERESVR